MIMIVTIKYCGEYCKCHNKNYIGEASSLEAAIKDATAIEDVFLREGSNGIFDVLVDDTLVYSKDETGRVPTNEEILDSIIIYDLGRRKTGF